MHDKGRVRITYAANKNIAAARIINTVFISYHGYCFQVFRGVAQNRNLVCDIVQYPHQSAFPQC